MKIYESTIYVQEPIGKEYYQLDVISQWYWITRSICFKNGISSCLRKYTRTSENTGNSEVVSELSEEMREELVTRGYTLAGERTENEL